MTDHLDCGAVTVLVTEGRRAPESGGVHGQGYGVGEKSWKRTEVVPPVSSLSHTEELYAPTPGKHKSPRIL